LREPPLADLQADVLPRNVPPGNYVLSIEAASGQTRQRRDVAFEIQPKQ
jgi:hypothetical protein